MIGILFLKKGLIVYFKFKREISNNIKTFISEKTIRYDFEKENLSYKLYNTVSFNFSDNKNKWIEVWKKCDYQCEIINSKSEKGEYLNLLINL